MIATPTLEETMLEEEITMDERKEAQHRGGSGNFADDRERAAEAGRKGGEHNHGQGQKTDGQKTEGQKTSDQPASGRDNRGSNFRDNPEKASEAGKKGGAHSHGGR